MTMTRRLWLSAAAAAGVGAALYPSTRLWAAPSGGSRLVVVMLRGAYDGLSALVPYSEPFYYEARPTIAIARPGRDDGDDLSAAMRLDGRWGLHPMLADNAGDLWAAKQMAFVPFCGTGFVSRSHFQAQDWMESGKLPEQRPDVNDGFLNRLIVQLGGEAVSFTQNLPVALRGVHKVANASVGRSLAMSAAPAGAYVDQVMAMYRGHALEPLVREGLGLRQALSMELMEEMDASGRNALPAAGFAMEALRVARYMRDNPKLSVAFIDVSGWDTHSGQGASHGLLAGRLGALGAGVEALAQELGPEWRNTVVVVMSEFGRTFRENGSKGTDHGHGNVMWIAGGAVSGGVVVGEQTALSAASLHENRDMPVLNEYRDVLGGLFARMYGLKGDALARVFPGSKPSKLQLI
jgi:uncharacterized protein (DUF1501 family)